MSVNNRRHRVVITGLGCVSAIGNDVGDFWRSLRDGRCGIGPITKVSSDNLAVGIAAEVKGFDPRVHFDRRQLNLLDPFAQFAMVAARQAIADSGLDFAGELGGRAAVILGTGKGGDATAEDGAHRLLLEGKAKVNPLTIPRAMASAAVSQIAIEHGITGPAFAVSSACASANHAIGQAFWMVRHGVVASAVTGGSEACLTFGTLKAWEAMRVTAPDTCRPFSCDRRGLVLGEGAGILVLESLESARIRGADILAEVAGFGMSSDAGDIVYPSEDGTARAIKAALDDAGLDPEDVQYVNGHGTGTKANDVTETRALHSVFKDHARKLAVSSTKSMHGHALGAAGALELVATVLAMHEGIAPPTANYSDRDPDCDLDYLPNHARDISIRAAISNSFAFGGLNAVLALRRVT